MISVAFFLFPVTMIFYLDNGKVENSVVDIYFFSMPIKGTWIIINGKFEHSRSTSPIQ